jgi:hypothetical protein
MKVMPKPKKKAAPTTKKKGKKISLRDRIRKRAEQRQGEGGVPYLKIEREQLYEMQKINLLDFLPYEITATDRPDIDAGEFDVARRFYVHRGIGADEKTYICPLRTNGKPCPICEHIAKLRKDPDVEEDEIKALYPKERELYNVIDLNNKKEGVKIFDISTHLFGKKLEEEINEGDEELADFADLEGGSTLKIRGFKKSWVAPSGAKVEFFETSRIDFKDRKDYDESILDDVFNLDEIMIILSYEELEKEYWGVSGGPEKDTKPAKKKGRKKPVEEEEEEEEEVDDDDVDEDEDEPEEEEEESEEEEEEEEESDDDEPEEEEEEEEEEEDSCSECPHDHTFGVDCNTEDECDDCECWDSCQDEKDRLEEEAKNKKPAKKGKKKKR